MDVVQDQITRLVRLEVEGLQSQLRAQVFAEVSRLRDNLELLATKAEVSSMQLSSCTEEIGHKVCEIEERMQTQSVELSSVRNRMEVAFRECQESLSRATSLRTIFAEKQERKRALMELSEVMPRLKALEDAIGQDTSMTLQDELTEAVPEAQQTSRGECSARVLQVPEARSSSNSRCSSAATFGGTGGVGSCLVAVTSEEPQGVPAQGDDCGPEQLQRRLEDTDRAVTGALRLQGRFAERFASLLTAHDARLSDISERVQLIHETTSPKGASCGEPVSLSTVATRLDTAAQDLAELQARMLIVERLKASNTAKADSEKIVPRMVTIEESIAEVQAQCARTEMRTTSMETHFATCMGHSKEMVTECGNQVVAQRGEMEQLKTRFSDLEKFTKSGNNNNNSNNNAEFKDQGQGMEAFKGEWDKLLPRIADLEDLMHLLRKDDQAQMKALHADVQKLTPRVEDLEAMQQADWERLEHQLAPRIASVEACQLELQKIGPRINELEAVVTKSSNDEVPSSQHPKGSEATSDSEKPEPALKESEAEAIINQLVPRIATLEESMDQQKAHVEELDKYKPRVEDLEVALSAYVEDMGSLNKVQSLPTLQQAVSTGVLESDRPSANGETNQEAGAHISVQSASTLPEEDREPMPAGSFVLDGRIVSPPAIREEAAAVDSCLTEAVSSPQAFGGSGSVLEASLPSCTTVEPEVANSLPSTPGATAGPHLLMPGTGRGAGASDSPPGSQSALVDQDSTRLSAAAKQSRAAASAAVANPRVAGPSPVLGMQSQFPPQMQQQQQQQQQHGSKPNNRQASQRRWTAPPQPQPVPGVPPPPDAWAPEEPHQGSTAEMQHRQQGSVLISEGISSLPISLLQAELLGQVPQQSRRSLPAGLHSSNTSKNVVYKPPTINPPTVQPPPARQSTPPLKQPQQQQQQTSQTPRRQQTPMRATTPNRQPQSPQPQTPRMAPLGPPLNLPPPPIPAALRASVGSQQALKQQPPTHKQQPGAEHRRPSDGTPQRTRPRLCAGYSMSPRRCVHSWVGPVGVWQRGGAGAGGTNPDRGSATPSKSQSTPASAPTSPLVSARR